MQCAQWLVVLRVRTLHMSLQRVGKAVVLVEECLANLRYPLVGIGIQVAIHRFTCPQRNVVQINHVVVGATINQGTHLTVTNR